MQDEGKDFNLSPETVQRAIEAIQARSSEVNASSVADELKVSRSVIYHNAEAIKLIIAASSGSFGMDVQTSLDLAWQLKKLEEQNSELIENLVLTKSVSQNTEFEQNQTNNFYNQNERIVNFAQSSPDNGGGYRELANMSWKELETIYYFKVSSLREHAKALFGSDSTLDKIELAVPSKESIALQSISYGTLISIETNKRERNFSQSPFARLKTSKTRIGQLPGEALIEPIFKPDAKPKKQVESSTKQKMPVQHSAQEALPVLIKGTEFEQKLEKEIIEQETIAQIKIEQPIKSESKDEQTATAPKIQGELKIYKEDEAVSAIELDWGGEIQKGTESNLSSVLKTGEKQMAEIPIETEIKLISLLKADSPPANSKMDANVEPEQSVKRQSDTGDLMPVQKKTDEGDKKEKTVISGDELRDLIQSHIKNAAEQMAESAHAYSIGTGKEFEVFLNNPARSKFVGSSKTQDSESKVEENTKLPDKGTFKPRILPPEVRKSCLILGVRTDNITYEQVQDSWKKAIAAPGVHPDQGGDTELAVYLNTAKDILVRWLDAQAPKLGKRFGQFKKEKSSPATKDTKKDAKKDQQ